MPTKNFNITFQMDGCLIYKKIIYQPIKIDNKIHSTINFITFAEQIFTQPYKVRGVLSCGTQSTCLEHNAYQKFWFNLFHFLNRIFEQIKLLSKLTSMSLLPIKTFIWCQTRNINFREDVLIVSGWCVINSSVRNS